LKCCRKRAAASGLPQAGCREVLEASPVMLAELLTARVLALRGKQPNGQPDKLLIVRRVRTTYPAGTIPLIC